MTGHAWVEPLSVLVYGHYGRQAGFRKHYFVRQVSTVIGWLLQYLGLKSVICLFRYHGGLDGDGKG